MDTGTMEQRIEADILEYPLKPTFRLMEHFGLEDRGKWCPIILEVRRKIFAETGQITGSGTTRTWLQRNQMKAKTPVRSNVTGVIAPRSDIKDVVKVVKLAEEIGKDRLADIVAQL